MKQFRFNVRVYGLWIAEGKVLISREKLNGEEIMKFPGGGLDFGEGLKDCLKREWMEELRIAIAVDKHFYTTDYFQPSFWDDSQVISVYYIVRPLQNLKIPFNNGQEAFEWLSIDENLKSKIALPIDKIVAEMLSQQGA